MAFYAGFHFIWFKCRSSKPAITVREQREAAKAMTQYFRDLNAAKNAEKAK